MGHNIKQNTDIDETKEKSYGFLGYLTPFAGFVIVMIVIAKLIGWLLA
jgi:hypothetical protein